MNNEREALIQKAIDLGIGDKGELIRKQSYLIEDLINKKLQKDRKKKHNSPKAIEDTNSDNIVVNQHQQIDKQQQIDKEDTETVCDLSYTLNAKNPSEEKYERFRSLTIMRNDLTNGIKTNIELIKAASTDPRADPEDLKVIENDIHEAQQLLALTVDEMHVIHQWFLEVQQQKLQFYKEMNAKVYDCSGNVHKHFNRKLDNINAYIKTIKTQEVQMFNQ